MTQKNPVMGALCKVLNGWFFAIMSIIFATLSKDLHITQILFIRFVIGAGLCLLVIQFSARHQFTFTLSKQRFLIYLSRASIQFIALYVFITAMNKIGINEITALGYTTPIWILIIAHFLYNEKLSGRSILITTISFCGILIILKPQLANQQITATCLALLSSLLWAIYEMICKKQTTSEHYLQQAFYVLLISGILVMPFALTHWQPIKLSHYSYLFILAIIGTANVVVLFLAYAWANATLIASFGYFRLLFVMLMSYLLYSTSITFDYIIGSLLILGSHGLLLWRKSRSANT